MLFFGQKCDEASGGQTGGQTGRQTGGQTLLPISVVFFSSYKLPKTVTVTTLLLFGHVTLLFGTFLFIKLSDGSVLTDRPTDTPKRQCEWSYRLQLLVKQVTDGSLNFVGSQKKTTPEDV